MGVPGFFNWVKNKTSNKFTIDVLNKKVDNLYIDTNGLIHPSCSQIINNLTYFISIEQLEKLMINNVIDNITNLIKIVNPQQLIYIAIDGVAPFAKITQQRARRYKKYFEDEYNLKEKKINYTNWSNVNITPGTPFMEKLHNHLKLFVDEFNSKNNIKMIYSSCYCSGEGEHKIIQYINSHTNNNINVIYGLDTDLIFLSIISKITKKQEIYLIRENPNIKDKLVYEYISINIFITNLLYLFTKYSSSIQLNSEIYTVIGKTGNEIKNLQNKCENMIIDFIFICFLIGNDFIHNLPFYDVTNLEIIIKIYINLYCKFGQGTIASSQAQNLINLSEKQQINIIFLNELFEELANQEKYIFKQKINNKNIPQDIKDIRERLNIVNIYDKITTYEDYKFKHYEYYCHTNYNQEIIIEKMSNEYLNGIKWTFDYYFNINNNDLLNASCPSWDWTYLFLNMPFISDVSKYIKKYNININEIAFKESNKLHFKQQLLYVIPRKYIKDIDLNLFNIMNDIKYSYLFPDNFLIDTQDKNILWKCEPIIPYVNAETIKKIII